MGFVPGFTSSETVVSSQKKFIKIFWRIGWIRYLPRIPNETDVIGAAAGGRGGGLEGKLKTKVEGLWPFFFCLLRLFQPEMRSTAQERVWLVFAATAGVTDPQAAFNCNPL